MGDTETDEATDTDLRVVALAHAAQLDGASVHDPTGIVDAAEAFHRFLTDQ
jgi:hypothetical protein